MIKQNIYPSDLKIQVWGTVFHELLGQRLGLKTVELVESLHKEKLNPVFLSQLLQLGKYPSPTFKD